MICQIDRAEESSDPRMIGVLISASPVESCASGIIRYYNSRGSKLLVEAKTLESPEAVRSGDRGPTRPLHQVERALRARFRMWI